MTVDQKHMFRAIELARRQKGRTGANPSVGCVILDRNGVKVSEAATGDGGRPHAEQLALSFLSPGAVTGGTIYVTLEPCRERSTQEASCSSRIIQAGIAKVVICHLDPHPLGRDGLSKLQDAGVSVDVGQSQEACEDLYAEFFASVEHTYK